MCYKKFETNNEYIINGMGAKMFELSTYLNNKTGKNAFIPNAVLSLSNSNK